MNTIEAIIEIPKGSFDKIEYDKVNDTWRVDRRLEIPYPASYGFVDGTLSEDGDPLDIFVISNQTLVSREVLTVYPKLVIEMLDGGVRDDKLVATTYPTNFVYVNEIVDFLEKYKKGTKVLGINKEWRSVYEQSRV